MAATIDTGKVADRRSIRYRSPAEFRADLDAIVAAERAGKLRRSGNWGVGQIFGHLAAFIDYAYDGYPSNMNPPWFIKLILRWRKNKYVRGPLPAGVKIPGIEGGTTGIEPLSLDEGLNRLTKAWDRLEKRPPAEPNIVFGPLSHEEWISLHLRHAELHLSFLHPAA